LELRNDRGTYVPLGASALEALETSAGESSEETAERVLKDVEMQTLRLGPSRSASSCQLL
jgi:hypothetical protein